MTPGWLFENVEAKRSEAVMKAIGDAEVGEASQGDQLWAMVLLIAGIIDARDDISREAALQQWDAALRWALEELDRRKALHPSLMNH